MGYWNYVVVQRPNKMPDGTLDKYEPYIFGVHEAFYNEEDGIWAVTEEPITIIGDSFESLHSQMNCILQAFQRPVIDSETYKWAPSGFDDDPVMKILDELDKPDLTPERRAELQEQLDEETFTTEEVRERLGINDSDWKEQERLAEIKFWKSM